MSVAPTYLDPYLRATRQHSAGFGSLLWASPKTQELRFDALTRAIDLTGKIVLDVGCGRGDLLDFLGSRGVRIKQYIGLEAIPPLAAVAKQKLTGNAKIIRGDFVRDPAQLNAGADVILFSGSLNTLDHDTFHNSIQRAFDSAKRGIAFNFLSSPMLAGASYLCWHDPHDVKNFARKFCDSIFEINDYLDGDCTLALHKAID